MSKPLKWSVRQEENEIEMSPFSFRTPNSGDEMLSVCVAMWSNLILGGDDARPPTLKKNSSQQKETLNP